MSDIGHESDDAEQFVRPDVPPSAINGPPIVIGNGYEEEQEPDEPPNNETKRGTPTSAGALATSQTIETDLLGGTKDDANIEEVDTSRFRPGVRRADGAPYPGIAGEHYPVGIFGEGSSLIADYFDVPRATVQDVLEELGVRDSTGIVDQWGEQEGSAPTLGDRITEAIEARIAEGNLHDQAATGDETVAPTAGALSTSEVIAAGHLETHDMSEGETTPAVEIAPSTPADAQAIGKLRAENWEEQYGQLDGVTEEWMEGEVERIAGEEGTRSRAHWIERAAQPGASNYWLTAKQADGSVVGFLEARRHDDGTQELRSLHVGSAHRGQNIGQALLDEAHRNWFDPAADIFLDVAEVNEAGQRFYARSPNNYELTGHRFAYGPINMLQMVRRGIQPEEPDR